MASGPRINKRDSQITSKSSSSLGSHSILRATHHEHRHHGHVHAHAHHHAVLLVQHTVSPCIFLCRDSAAHLSTEPRACQLFFSFERPQGRIAPEKTFLLTRLTPDAIVCLNRGARGVARDCTGKESRRRWDCGAGFPEEWTCEGEQNGRRPQYGRRSWLSVSIRPARDGALKWARKCQAGWYRRSVAALVPAFAETGVFSFVSAQNLSLKRRRTP